MSISKYIEKWEHKQSHAPKDKFISLEKAMEIRMTNEILADLRALKAEQGETSDKGRQDALKEAERQEGKQ